MINVNILSGRMIKVLLLENNICLGRWVFFYLTFIRFFDSTSSYLIVQLIEFIEFLYSNKKNVFIFRRSYT